MRVIRFSEGNLREILENLTGLTFIRDQSGGSKAETQKLLLLTSSVSEVGGRGGGKLIIIMILITTIYQREKPNGR